MYELLDNWITPWAEQSYEGYLVFLALCIVAGFYLLTKGGDWLSDHSSNIACQLGVPPVVVGLTIVSIATSTPELFTSLSALRSGSPGLVLGNVIGSNIANVGLILGIALLLGKISTQGAVSLAQRHCLFWITIGFCLALLLLPRGELGLIPGSLLLAFICFYLVTVTNHALRNKQRMKTAEELSASENTPTTSLILSVCVVGIATLALWIGSDSLVYGSKSLAIIAGVPEELIGFTLLAIGTSLPELAASISLVRKAQTSMLLGNIVGSNLFNISLIGGLAGIMGPVRSGAPHPWIDYISLLVTTMILIHWLGGKTLTQRHGLFLLLTYILASISTWMLNS
ncbi:MAG: calcium/sodium antiporter [Opitutales bacterium]|nr:calcium/sodium antiporter [Opitutales bacterium]